MVLPIARLVKAVLGKGLDQSEDALAIRISGLPEDESRAGLGELFAWTAREEFIYRHDWRVSDAVLRDNACTMHCRDDFDGEYERMMYRTTILPQPNRAVPF